MMVGLWAFLVWTCVLGSSYVHSQGTTFTVANNLNLPVPIVKSPNNSETLNHLLKLNAGNTPPPITVTPPPNPDLNIVGLTAAPVQSPVVEPVNPLAQQLEAVANGNLPVVTASNPVLNPIVDPVTNVNPAPEVTQSPAVTAEPINTVEKLPAINPILLVPAATNAVESVTMPSNPASSVTNPPTGSTNPLSTGLNAVLNEVANSGSPVKNQASASSGPIATTETTALNNPLPIGSNMPVAEVAEPAPALTNTLSTALNTALTQAAKPASAVTNPESTAANSVPIAVNPEVLSVTPTTVATNSVATETPTLISAILASAASGVTQGTVSPAANIIPIPIPINPATATETPTPLNVILASAVNAVSPAPVNTVMGPSVTNSLTAPNTTQGSALVNSSANVNANASIPGINMEVTSVNPLNNTDASLAVVDVTATNTTLNTTQGSALINSSVDVTASNTTLNTTQGSALTNSSVNANASSTGFNVTAVDPLNTTTPIDPLVQKRIDQGVLEVGARFQSNIDFYTRSLQKIDDLMKDILERKAIMEVAIKNLPQILAGMITKPTQKVKLSEILREANATLALQATTVAPGVSIVSALASVAAGNTSASAFV